MKAKNNNIPDVTPVHGFASRAAWAIWLEHYHRKSPGVWLRLAKKSSGLKSVSYPEAVEVALCYGWIDGQNQSDPQDLAAEVCSSLGQQRMVKDQPAEGAGAHPAREDEAGGQESDRARQEQRKLRAGVGFPGPRPGPSDLRAAPDANARAKAFFTKLDGANRCAVLFRIQTVKKPETRARKIREFVEMLEQNQTIHPVPAVVGVGG